MFSVVSFAINSLNKANTILCNIAYRTVYDPLTKLIYSPIQYLTSTGTRLCILPMFSRILPLQILLKHIQYVYSILRTPDTVLHCIEYLLPLIINRAPFLIIAYRIIFPQPTTDTNKSITDPMDVQTMLSEMKKNYLALWHLMANFWFIMRHYASYKLGFIGREKVVIDPVRVKKLAYRFNDNFFTNE